MRDAEQRALAWRCRRGMRELDVVLSAYLDTQFASAEPGDQDAFRRLLDLQDPEIFGFLTGRAESPDVGVQRIVRILQRRAER